MKKVFVWVICFFLFESCSLFDPQDSVPPNFDEASSDKFLFNVSKGSLSTDWVYCGERSVDFSEYEHIDSIIFVPNLRSQTAEQKCIAEVYNQTLDLPVNNSRLESVVRYTLHQVRSPDLKSYLVNGDYTIGIRFRTTSSDNYVEIGEESFLVVYYSLGN